MNNETIVARILQLESDVKFWKEAHLKLQEEVSKLQNHHRRFT